MRMPNTWKVSSYFLVLIGVTSCGIGMSTNEDGFLKGPAELAFGEVLFDAESQMSLTLYNFGQSEARDIGVSFSSTSFGFAGGTFPGVGGDCGALLAPGSSCTLGLSFRAASSFRRDEGNVTIAYRGTLGPLQLEVPVSGTAGNLGFRRAGGLSAVSWFVTVVPGTYDLLVSGFFTSYDGTAAQKLVRLNQDGSIDSALDATAGASNAIRQVAPLADGRIYVAGDFASYRGTGTADIVRILPGGPIDTSFVTGTGFTPNTVTAVQLAQDGSGDLYVAGDFSNYNGFAVSNIIRLNSDGTRDPAFNVGSGFDARVWDLIVPNNGSGDVYALGIFQNYNGTTANRIARLNSDGSLDTQFNTGTGFSWDVQSGGEGLNGEIVAVGDFTSYNGTSAVRVAKIDSSGALVSGFNTGTGFNSGIHSTLVLDDGRTLVCGVHSTYQGAAVPRLLALKLDGSIDPSFDVGTGPSDLCHRIINAPDGTGDIYVVGEFLTYDGTTAERIMRLDRSGNLE